MKEKDIVYNIYKLRKKQDKKYRNIYGYKINKRV